MFRDHVLNVAASKAKKYLVGYRGEAETVFNVGRTLSEVILAPTRRTVIMETYEANDYKLPTGTGLLELANIGRVYLFDDVIATAPALPAKSTDCIIAQWKTECMQGKVLTPKALEKVLSEFYGYAGESVAFTNVAKCDYSLESFSHLYEDEGHLVKHNDGSRATFHELVAYYLKLNHPFMSEFGRRQIPIVREECQSEWLFNLPAIELDNGDVNYKNKDRKHAPVEDDEDEED